MVHRVLQVCVCLLVIICSCSILFAGDDREAFPYLKRFDTGETIEVKGLRSFSTDDLTIRIGRQKDEIDAGRTWKAAALTDRNKLVDPSYEIDTRDGAYMSWWFTDEHELATFYSLEEDSPDPLNALTEKKGHEYQLKMTTHKKFWDLAIHYSEGTQKRSDYDKWAKQTRDDVAGMTSPVRWRLLAVGVKGELGRLGLHAEGGRTWMKSDKEDEQLDMDPAENEHHRFLVGMDYTFENELYLVLEYYQDDQIRSAYDEYEDKAAFEFGGSTPIGRNNLFVGARYPIAGKASIELYNIINANDPSVLLNPWLVWNARENIKVSFSAHIPVGKEDTSFGQRPPTAFGRIQLNF